MNTCPHLGIALDDGVWVCPTCKIRLDYDPHEIADEEDKTDI